MGAWFLVEFSALISGNLFCWKLSTCDLKFPGGRWPLKRVLQPTQLLARGWLRVYLRISVENGIIKCPFPSFPFSSWTLREKTNKGGWDLWVPRKLTLSQISDHPSPPRLLWGMFAGLQLWGRPGNERELPWEHLVGSAFCSLDSSTDCFDFCGYVIVMCSQGTNMFTT